MGSNLARALPPGPNTPLPPTNQLWERAARSLGDTQLVAGPAAGATIVKIAGFQTWQQDDIYRIDWLCFYDTTAGPANDMALFIGGERYRVLPVVGATNVPTAGTVFVAADSFDISIQAIAGGNGHYSAGLTLTRYLNGFRAG